MTARGGLEAALDALYAKPPAEFTKARDALAKSLDDKGAAAEVRARRKPSLVAYALNQIARTHADDVAELVDVGRALARAQRKALRGDAADDLRAAITRQRDALRGLVRKASSLLRELDVPATHLAAITAALQTALVDPAAAEALEAGRLDAVPEAAADFLGDISGLPAPPPPKAVKPVEAKAVKPKRDLAAEKKERAAAEARAARKREAESAARAARKEADAAQAAADEAVAHARDAEAVAKRAEKAAQAFSGR